ncbi:MAG: hypothetical protein U1F83_11585 [Verrucomicrobiota bacterium]|jgi:hypothetical protein
MSANAITTWSGGPAPVFGSVLAMRTLLEYAIYLGAIMIVTAIVTLWIATSRQPLQHADHREQRRSRSRLGRWLGLAGKKRRRRRSRRKRNPTLAETGGLPPIRADAASPAEQSEP